MSSDAPARRYRLRVCAVVATSRPEIIEFGRVDIHVEGTKIVQSCEPLSALYRPAGSLPRPEDIAGITAGNVLGRPICDRAAVKAAIWSPAPPDLLVAHDASTFKTLLPPTTHMPLPWVSTYKIARQIWPWASGFTLDELVEWRGLREGRERVAPHPDRAAAQARDTAALLTDLIQLGTTLNQMLLLSAVITAPLAPPPLPNDESGWRLVPDDDLTWLARFATNLPIDVRTRASRERARRIARVGEGDTRFEPPVLPD